MRTHPVIWAWFRFRPQIGWLPLFLLVAIVSCLASAVLEVGWVPEDGVIIPTVTFGLLLSTFLGQRRLSWLPAWLLITAYGLLITILDLAQLWLPFPQIFQGWEPTRQVWLQNGALFLDRMGSWFRAASTNGTSRETIVFAFGLGLVAYFLVAYVGWATFRRRRPLPGLATMGVVLAINGYYGTAQIWWTGIFVGLMALMTAVMHYAQLEQTWETNRVDYSTEVRTDLLVYAGAIALILFMMALALPAFSITKLRQAFARQTAVQEVEDVLERVFAGVVQPRQIDAEVIPERARGGVMPRDYLLGNAPELQETVMMTAVVTIESPGGASILAPPELLYGKHWRALSYDIYTGRGWAISSERKEPIPANTAIQLPAMDKQITATQRVHWFRSGDHRLLAWPDGSIPGARGRRTNIPGTITPDSGHTG
jgi:hypothetical protein